MPRRFVLIAVALRTPIHQRSPAVIQLRRCERLVRHRWMLVTSFNVVKDDREAATAFGRHLAVDPTGVVGAVSNVVGRTVGGVQQGYISHRISVGCGDHLGEYENVFLISAHFSGGLRRICRRYQAAAPLSRMLARGCLTHCRPRHLQSNGESDCMSFLRFTTVLHRRRPELARKHGYCRRGCSSARASRTEWFPQRRGPNKR